MLNEKRCDSLLKNDERVGGIEPPSSAWKADIKAIIRYPLVCI